MRGASDATEQGEGGSLYPPAPSPLEFFSKKDGGGGENDIIPPMQTAFSVFSRARAAFCGGVWS